MRKTPWLTRSAINGDPNVDDITDTTEEIIQISVGHLEGHVTDEQGLAWRVLGPTGGLLWSALARLRSVGMSEGYRQTAAFKCLLMEGIDSSLCAFGGLKFNITETAISQ